MSTENSDLRVVAYRQVDGGHWYYGDGLSSDPRAEHLVRFSDASSLLTEKDAEIERLTVRVAELQEEVERWYRRWYRQDERFRARFAELEPEFRLPPPEEATE